jgi:hypothetical protein
MKQQEKFYHIYSFKAKLIFRHLSITKAAFLAFLMTFSYMMLCEFDFYHAEEYYLNIINNTFIDANSTDLLYTPNDLHILKKKFIKSPSIVEVFLTIWIITIIVEEVRQVIYLL